MSTANTLGNTKLFFVFFVVSHLGMKLYCEQKSQLNPINLLLVSQATALRINHCDSTDCLACVSPNNRFPWWNVTQVSEDHPTANNKCEECKDSIALSKAQLTIYVFVFTH